MFEDTEGDESANGDRHVSNAVRYALWRPRDLCNGSTIVCSNKQSHGVCCGIASIFENGRNNPINSMHYCISVDAVILRAQLQDVLQLK